MGGEDGLAEPALAAALRMAASAPETLRACCGTDKVLKLTAAKTCASGQTSVKWPKSLGDNAFVSTASARWDANGASSAPLDSRVEVNGLSVNDVKVVIKTPGTYMVSGLVVETLFDSPYTDASTRTYWGFIQSGNVYVRLITASGSETQTSIVDTKFNDSIGGQQVVLYHLHGFVSTYQENQKLAVYAEVVVSSPAGHPVVMRARVAHFQVARVR